MRRHRRRKVHGFTAEPGCCRRSTARREQHSQSATAVAVISIASDRKRWAEVTRIVTAAETSAVAAESGMEAGVGREGTAGGIAAARTTTGGVETGTETGTGTAVAESTGGMTATVAVIAERRTERAGAAKERYDTPGIQTTEVAHPPTPVSKGALHRHTGCVLEHCCAGVGIAADVNNGGLYSGVALCLQ